MNRGYADNCRKKRLEEEKELEHENEKIRREICWKQHEIKKSKEEVEELMRRSACLEKEMKLLQAEHDQYEKQLMATARCKDQEQQANPGNLKYLMANRTEIKWEKVNPDHDNADNTPYPLLRI